MESETDVKRWLKQQYRETPSSGLAAKKVMFSDVEDELGRQYPSSHISTQTLSQAIGEEFPKTVKK